MAKHLRVLQVFDEETEGLLFRVQIRDLLQIGLFGNHFYWRTLKTFGHEGEAVAFLRKYEEHSEPKVVYESSGSL